MVHLSSYRTDQRAILSEMYNIFVFIFEYFGIRVTFMTKNTVPVY